MLPKEIAATTLIDAQQIIQNVPLWQNIALGASILLALIWINVFFQRRISLNFEINARVNLSRARYNVVFLNYFTAITYLVLVQFLAIAIWALMLRVMELIQDPTDALLFAGSCYTTIGFVSDVMPTGWKLLALFIALSGLFSIALSTAVMLSMSPLFRYAWMKKHETHINRKLKKWHVSLPEMDMPSMAFVHTTSTSQQPTAEEN
ncbi:MAG: ion channel [Fluviibacter sp.]|jgi:hypothetical protein